MSPTLPTAAPPDQRTRCGRQHDRSPPPSRSTVSHAGGIGTEHPCRHRKSRAAGHSPRSPFDNIGCHEANLHPPVVIPASLHHAREPLNSPNPQTRRAGSAHDPPPTTRPDTAGGSARRRPDHAPSPAPGSRASDPRTPPQPDFSSAAKPNADPRSRPISHRGCERTPTSRRREAPPKRRPVVPPSSWLTPSAVRINGGRTPAGDVRSLQRSGRRRAPPSTAVCSVIHDAKRWTTPTAS